MCSIRFNIQQFYVMPTLYLCVLCRYENKQLLFPHTALTEKALWPCIIRLLCGTKLNFKYTSSTKAWEDWCKRPTYINWHCSKLDRGNETSVSKSEPPVVIKCDKATQLAGSSLTCLQNDQLAAGTTAQQPRESNNNTAARRNTSTPITLQNADVRHQQDKCDSLN